MQTYGGVRPTSGATSSDRDQLLAKAKRPLTTTSYKEKFRALICLEEEEHVRVLAEKLV